MTSVTRATAWAAGAVLAAVGATTPQAAARDGSDELLCQATGGTWDPVSCGHSWCGHLPDCLALVPGCDCGAGRTFVPDVGCVADPTCPNFCPADLDGDLDVGFGDLLAVLAAWGPCADCPEDLDGSGAVGFGDVLALLGAWGSCLFDYGPIRESAEAEQISLELLGAGGPLLVPDDAYERVLRDLSLARAAIPELAAVPHSAAFLPDSIVVGLNPDLPHDDYDTLGVYYQVAEVLPSGSGGGIDWYQLTFPRNVNVATLGLIYAALEEVEVAESIGLVGRPTFWAPAPQPDGTWRWQIESGWLDCQVGCICRHVWIADVAAGGEVTLVSYTPPTDPLCLEPEGR